MKINKALAKAVEKVNKNRNKNFVYKIIFSTKDIISRRWRTYRGYKYWVIEEYKTMHLPVYKAGSTTIQRTLSKITSDRKKIHPFASSRDFLKKYKDEYFMFSLSRNPYDRLVSGYFDKINKSYEGSGKVYRNLGPRNFHKDMSFKEFVKELFKDKDKDVEEHFRSQYRLLADKQGNLIPHFIGKVENFDEDFKKVCQRMGIPDEKIPKIEKQNTTKRDRDYRKYYDEETKKLVQERYKKDLELFGYEF